VLTVFQVTAEVRPDNDRFKDLYLWDFVHAGKMVWRDRYRNVELTYFQEEMMA